MRKTLFCVATFLCSASLYGQEPNRTPPPRSVEAGQRHWEYKVVTWGALIAGKDGRKPAEEELNKLGQEGWELVSVDAGSTDRNHLREPSCFFKRAKGGMAMGGVMMSGGMPRGGGVMGSGF